MKLKFVFVLFLMTMMFWNVQAQPDIKKVSTKEVEKYIGKVLDAAKDAGDLVSANEVLADAQATVMDLFADASNELDEYFEEKETKKPKNKDTGFNSEPQSEYKAAAENQRKVLCETYQNRDASYIANKLKKSETAELAYIVGIDIADISMPNGRLIKELEIAELIVGKIQSYCENTGS